MGSACSATDMWLKWGAKARTKPRWMIHSEKDAYYHGGGAFGGAQPFPAPAYLILRLPPQL